MVVDFNINEIGTASKSLLEMLGELKIIAFHGELGAGKTTLISAICEELGSNDQVSSPTFSIINEYDLAGGIIYHLDLYRISGEAEAAAAGVEDCIYSGSYCFIEWPEKAPGLIPDHTVHCYITVTGPDTRKLQINL